MKNYSDFQSELLQQFPIAKHLQVNVVEFSQEKCRVDLPLSANSNHHGTAFGGSIYCAAVIAGYGLHRHLIAESDWQIENVVIQEGNIQYLKPLSQNIIAVCYRPSSEEVASFQDQVQKKKKARLALTAKVYNSEKDLAEQNVAASFTGYYICKVK